VSGCEDQPSRDWPGREIGRKKMKMEKTRAEARVKAAKLRILAAEQRAMAAGYRRQAAHPVYPGQDTICLDKADQIAALAAREEAEAAILDAG